MTVITNTGQQHDPKAIWFDKKPEASRYPVCDFYQSVVMSNRTIFCFGDVSPAELNWINTNSAFVLAQASPTAPVDNLQTTAFDLLRIGSGIELLPILWGAINLIRRYRPWLVLDCAHDWKGSMLDGTLHALGYQPGVELETVFSDTSSAAKNTTWAFAPMPQTYSRQHPSARYVQLLSFYRDMHQNGFTRVDSQGVTHAPAPEAFQGQEICGYAETIRGFVRMTASRNVLDYGSGKGHQYQLRIAAKGKLYSSLREYWGVDSVSCYEPGQALHEMPPNQTYDLVVCTDVLEHVPIQDLVWVVDELFRYARKAVFASIACYPAIARLPDGSNAHVTLQPPAWWHGLLNTIATSNARTHYLAPTEAPNKEGVHEILWLCNFPIETLTPYIDKH